MHVSPRKISSLVPLLAALAAFPAGDAAGATSGSGSTAERPAPTPRAGNPRLAKFTATRGGSATIAVTGLGQSLVWFDTPHGSGFDLEASPVNVGWANGVPTAYVIEASSDGGGTWSELVDVPRNTYATWAHVVDLSGRDRVRMRLTADPLGRGSIELGVHDARGGLDDIWLFLGDSNTAAVFRGVYAGDTGRFGLGVHERDPARWPVAINGGVAAGLIPHFLRTRGDPWRAADGTGTILYPDTKGRPQPLFRKWMKEFPGRFVSIAIGTNDINGFSWRPATSADLDAMQSAYERLIEEALAAGKTVILPSLRWCKTNPHTAANLAAWNERLWKVILPKYPSVLRGPDVYAGSANRPEWLADGSHPNDAGRKATLEAWIDWAMANVYARR